MSKRKYRKQAEAAARVIFGVCAFFAVLAVGAIFLYMLVNGIPAIRQLGLKNILFGTVWKPVAENPEYGILYIILTSLLGTVLAALAGVPIGVLTAVYLAEVAEPGRAVLVRDAVEVLAGIPSVIYGLLGVYLLGPAMYRLERKIFAGSRNHQFTGGANLLSAVLVLAVMILPTVIHVSESSIRGVPREIREASMALGASRIQTIFRSVLPSARPGIVTAAVLGVGRAMGEAMAITLVSGGCVNFPLPFGSVRFLTTAIVSEMGYAQGIHREVLFTIGLVLFGFIMLVNVAANHILRVGGEGQGE